MNIFPYISVGGVEAALDSIRYTASEKQFDAMLSLAIVDEYLLYHDFPQGDQRRQFALREILVDAIIDQYAYLREAVLEQSYVFPENLSELRDIVVADAESENSELRTWSLLFAKYGTTLLEANTNTLEYLYSVSSRSIRRYIQYGYRALADILIAKEQEARQKMHRRRLSANLPSHRLSFHIGRQYEINRLQYAYQTHRGVRLLVTGEEGIGKTHLLDVFLREQLHTDYAPQHLIWMYQPKTTQGIIAHLLDHLLRDAGRASLKDYAQMHRIVLILDSAENVLPDIPTLSAELGQVDILISATRCQNRQTLQLLHDHIHLGPLSADETDAYIRYLQKADDLIVDNDIWRQTGNPGYIRAAARAQLQSDGLSVTLESVLPDVPTELAVRLLAAVFLPDEPVNVSSKILPEQFNAVIEKHGKFYYVSNSEVDRLQSAWQAGHQHELLHWLIAEMTTSDQPIPFGMTSKQIDLAEQILFQIPSLSNDHQEKLLLHYWEDAADNNRLRTWLTLLEAYLVDVDVSNNDVLHAMGVIQNRLGNRQDAIVTLEKVIQNTGIADDFNLQARALLSVSSVYRKIGKYERALEKIRQSRQQTTDADIRQRTWLSEAQIMLEADNASELAYCLEQVHLLVTDAPSVAVLRSQLAYMREHYEEGIEYARQLEQSHPAQAQALIAQGCMMLGHLDQAENHFMHAMREMRDINDTYTLARVGTNLAVCLMQYDEWERAYALLKQSRRQQTENQDKVGLLTTEHNLRIAQENLSYLW